MTVWTKNVVTDDDWLPVNLHLPPASYTQTPNSMTQSTDSVWTEAS
jgi:hypothetical protein